MAGETLSFATPGTRVQSQSWIADAGFVIFLLLIFVGLTPFAIRDPAVLSAGESGFSGAGDIARQLSYLAAFALIGFAAVQQRGLKALWDVSPVFAALLLWCALSAVWAAAPGVTFRRAVLAIVIVLSAMWSVETLGSERSLKIWRFVLAGVLVVNFLSIPIIPQSIHLHGEVDPSLVGDWRGLYFHKNIAGSVSAITALVFFFSMLNSRRPLDAILFVAAVIFTAKTHSKSSLGLLPIAIAFGCSYFVTWRRGIDRAIVYVALALAAALVAGIIAIDSGVIARALEDPTQFTGRAAIWQAELAYIRDHLLLGSGFGSFADTGASSPLRAYVGDAWVQNVAHGHNAYLQLFVTIGGVGFALALLAFVAEPLGQFRRVSDNTLKPMLFAIFVFMVLHNFLESDFLEGDGPAWVAFLLMLGMLRALPLGMQTRQSVES